MTTETPNGKKWFHNIAVQVTVAGFIGVTGAALTTWAQTKVQTERLEGHEKRLDKIEKRDPEIAEIQKTVAAIGRDIEAVRDAQKDASRKIDLLLENSLKKGR